MQEILVRQEGIEDATVTFTVPENSNYIWDQSNQQNSSANVSVLMKSGYELTPERVSAIKHLAATSVPKLSVEDVVVVDASTGVEMPGVDDPESAGYYSVRRLEFERAISKQIEDNIKRLLAGKYGPDGVTAVATVSLDYDKMMSESKQYQPRDNGDGGGVINHFDENYTLNDAVPAEGIVGEENNTDAPPQYPNAEGDGNAAATDYQRSIDYDVSYVLTQIEKGEPILEDASVAVVVNDPNFTTQVQETLVDLISKAVNINTEDIRVTNLDYSSQPVNAPVSDTAQGLTQRQWLLIGLGGILLLVLVLLLRRSPHRSTAMQKMQNRPAKRRMKLVTT